MKRMILLWIILLMTVKRTMIWIGSRRVRNPSKLSRKPKRKESQIRRMASKLMNPWTNPSKVQETKEMIDLKINRTSGMSF